MRQRGGRSWWRLVRIVVTLALLGWLIIQVDVAELVALGGIVVWPLVVLAVALQVVGVFLSAFKWWLVLQGSRQAVPYLWAVQAYFIGQFFNNFLPTMIGGDAIRVYQLSQRTKRPAIALASVFIERVTGFLALTVIGAVALGLTFPALQAVPAVLWATVGCFVVAAAGLYVAAFAPGLARLLMRAPLPNVADWRGKLSKLVQMLTGAYTNRRTLVLVILLSFAYQLSWIGLNYTVIRSLALPVSFGFTALMVPVSDIVGLVPIFFNNIGARSGTFVVLLNPLGIAPVSVIALSMIVYLIRMAVSCVGGILYIVGGLTGTHQRLGANTGSGHQPRPASQV